jgi:membrane associated rhomboid family serine protease
MQDPARGASEPILNLPGSVLLAAAVMIVIQIVRGLLPDDLGVQFLLALAFIPARYSGAAPELPGGYLTAVTSFVTYMIVHGGWVHLLVNFLWMAAFGSAVARRVGNARFFSFSILCGIAGAFTHLALHFGEMAPVVGASAAISGQMAAALRFVFGVRPAWGEGAPDFNRARLETLAQTLTDRRILVVLAFWLGINAIFGLGMVSIAGAEGQIAWEAHIGGFLFGLLGFGFFDRGDQPEAPQPARSSSI